MGRAHAILSASSAHRWINCTPSARLAEQVEDTGSDYAQEGTLAHQLAELVLSWSLNRVKKATYSKQLKAVQADPLYSSEMPAEVEKYMSFTLDEFAAAKVQDPGAVLILEEKVDLTKYIKEGFGSCDAIIIADGTMKVIDLKYGKGVTVDSKDNDQLKLYALGALDAFEFAYDVHTVELCIIQPRLNNFSLWETPVEELKLWADKILIPKALEAFDGKGIQKAGDWCKFCPVKARCSTLASVNLKVAQHEFKSPHLLTDAQIIDVYKQTARIADWIKAVADHILKEALAGKTWPGFKLVEGRSMRKWNFEDDAIKVLKAQGFTDEQILNIKLKGIGEIEKLLKTDFDKILSSFVIKPAGKPTLVETSDPRQALGGLDGAKKEFNI